MDLVSTRVLLAFSGSLWHICAVVDLPSIRAHSMPSFPVADFPNWQKPGNHLLFFPNIASNPYQTTPDHFCPFSSITLTYNVSNLTGNYFYCLRVPHYFIFCFLISFLFSFMISVFRDNRQSSYLLSSHLQVATFTTRIRIHASFHTKGHITVTTSRI